jgi:hypothetical protein
LNRKKGNTTTEKKAIEYERRGEGRSELDESINALIFII